MPSSPRPVLVLALVSAALVGPAFWAMTPVSDAGRPFPLERSEIEVAAAPVVATADRAELHALAPTTTTSSPSSTTTTTTTTTVVRPTTTTAPATTTTTTVVAAPPVTSTTTTTAPTAHAASTWRDHECESSMHAWMDQSRSEHGLAALVDDPEIQHIPLDWSRAMADRADLAHNPHYGDQIFAVRAEAHTAAENVGRSAVSARAIYDEFLRSETHRAQIVGDFTHAAVGCVRDAGDQLWVTVDFWA